MVGTGTNTKNISSIKTIQLHIIPCTCEELHIIPCTYEVRKLWNIERRAYA